MQTWNHRTMKTLTTVPFGLVVLLGSLGCQEPPSGPPFDTGFTVKQVMNGVLDPLTDVYWDSVGFIITAEGTEEIMPHTDEEWAEVVHAAMVVVESGNLLMMDGRAVDQGQWIEHCKELIAAGKQAVAAAEAQDRDEVFVVGGYIYDACTNCHSQYIQEQSSEPLPARSVPPQESE